MRKLTEADDDTETTDEDTPVTVDVLVNDTDPDGDTLTVDSVTDPTNGSVVNNGNNVTYTPDSDFNGIDTFTYTVTDGNGGTDTATVSVTVNPVNDPPEANDDDDATTDEDKSVTIDVLTNDTDLDGDTLTVDSVTDPANGSVTNNGNSVIYTPDPDFNGVDTFTYTVADGNGGTDTATVTVTVNPVNDPPVAYNQSVSTDENIPVAITLTASDVDGTLTFTIVSGPSHGSLGGTPPDVTYTPDTNYSGTDSFTFKANDGTVDSNTATVSITVNSVNDPPEITSTPVTEATEDQTYTYDVEATDPDEDDELTYSLTTFPDGMTIDEETGEIEWTPTNEQVGDNDVVVQVADLAGVADTQEFTITVGNVNDPPEITSTPITEAIQDALYTYDVEATDPDEDDELTYSLITSPDGMTIDEDTGEIEWTPTEEQLGDNDVVVRVADTAGATDTQDFTINVEPPDLTLEAFSPVDLVITDPKGRVISKEGSDESVIPPPAYTEEDLDGDGDLDDKVVIPDAVVGDYSIEVVSGEEADPATDRYTLDVTQANEEPETLVDDDPVPPPRESESHTHFFSQCDMEQGWNLISVPVQLADNSLAVALKSIDGHFSSIWTYERTDDDTDGEWRKYIADAPPWLNDLETIDPRKGYWIRMDDSTALTLGEDQVADEPIPLKLGWNLVGYSYLKALPLEEALPPGNYNSVWTYDPTGGKWEKYIAYGPASVSDLEMMEPGKGYWVDARVDCIWDVSKGTLSAPTSLPVAAESERARPLASFAEMASAGRPGIPYIIWGSVEDNGVKMTRRSNCTVVLKVDNEVRSSYRLGTVNRYGDFYVLDVPGTTDSSSQIELCVQLEDTMTEAALISPGRPGQVMRFDLHVRVIPKISLLYQNYPNPSNPETWIPYRLEEDADVVIKIYSVTGQIIRTLNLGHKQAGFHTSKVRAAYWDGKNEAGEHVASGVYFYSVKAGDLIATRKMAVAK